MQSSENSASFQPSCRNLRCKEMYYQADQDDEFASGIHWCQQTNEPFGPDGEPCSKKTCCEGRSCFLK